MSTVKFDKWENSDGTENYKCRAWVNFNGTGTVAIRASGNVSSITDNGTGNYTVNFTTAMPDANYCVTSTRDNAGDGGRSWNGPVINTFNVGSIHIFNMAGDSGINDSTFNSVSIFR